MSDLSCENSHGSCIVPQSEARDSSRHNTMSNDSRNSPILNRREFLGSSAINAAGAVAGVVGWSGVAAASSSSLERITVGVIGIRNHGKLLATELSRMADVRVSAVCDVDTNLLPLASKAVEAAQGQAPCCESDFHRLIDDPTIDAIVVATPDHWHASMTILACQAGKDVYVEKPVSHSIAEGDAMIAAANSSRRIIQTGLQQRSGEQFRSAIEFVQSGKLGSVHLAKAWTAHQRKPIGFKGDASVPPGVKYDLWLGPAPARAFNPNRFHYNWRWFWDYGTGELGNWGVHLLDIARWGLGVDFPSRVSATGGKFYFRDDQETPDTLLVNFSYPSKTITWEHRLWTNQGQEGRSAAVAFVGDRGTLIVDRSGWKVYGQKDSFTAESSELLPAHLRNFIDCIKSRRSTNADLTSAHVSSAMCHLGNLAFRSGQNLNVAPRTNNQTTTDPGVPHSELQ